jgi:centrobin
MFFPLEKTVTRLEQSLSEAMEALNREQEGVRLQQREKEALVRRQGASGTNHW